MRTSLLALLFLGNLGTTATAQLPRPLPTPGAPRFAGVYHVAEGRLEPGPTVRGIGEVIWNNAAIQPYYSVPGAEQEWVDSGVLHARNTSGLDQIQAFDFTYCSATPDGDGNGTSITITFYDEHLQCTGPTFTGASCAYELTGIPAGDANGSLQCWTLVVDLEGVECTASCLDPFRVTTEFGWGFRPADANTGPWLAGGGHGGADLFEWFDASNADGRPLDATDYFLGCFWFGCTPLPEASFSMRLFGPEPDELVLRSSAPALHALDLLVDFNAGGTSTWSVTGGSSPSHWLVASAQCTDLLLPAGWGLLVEPSLVIPPTPQRMTAGVLSAQTPSNVPAGTVTQVLGGTSFTQSGLQESSPAYLHN